MVGFAAFEKMKGDAVSIADAFDGDSIRAQIEELRIEAEKEEQAEKELQELEARGGQPVTLTLLRASGPFVISGSLCFDFHGEYFYCIYCYG